MFNNGRKEGSTRLYGSIEGKWPLYTEGATSREGWDQDDGGYCNAALLRRRAEGSVGGVGVSQHQSSLFLEAHCQIRLFPKMRSRWWSGMAGGAKLWRQICDEGEGCPKSPEDSGSQVPNPKGSWISYLP